MSYSERAAMSYSTQLQMVCEERRKQNNRRGEVSASASLEVLMRTLFMLVQEQHWSEGEKN